MKSSESTQINTALNRFLFDSKVKLNWNVPLKYDMINYDHFNTFVYLDEPEE